VNGTLRTAPNAVAAIPAFGVKRLRAARNALATLLIGLLVGAFLPASIAPALARENAAERNEVAVANLPHEAREVLARIRAGGPFPFERDGVTFGNREQSLPPRKRGFYREYTVITPGVRTRGARRIVCGGPRRTPEACFYSDDHYASFRRIRE
jgi:ribonuclease T1